MTATPLRRHWQRPRQAGFHQTPEVDKAPGGTAYRDGRGMPSRRVTKPAQTTRRLPDGSMGPGSACSLRGGLVQPSSCGAFLDRPSSVSGGAGSRLHALELRMRLRRPHPHARMAPFGRSLSGTSLVFGRHGQGACVVAPDHIPAAPDGRPLPSFIIQTSTCAVLVPPSSVGRASSEGLWSPLMQPPHHRQIPA